MEKKDESCVTVNMDRVLNVVLHEEKLLLICGDPSEDESTALPKMEIYEIDKNIFNKMFPSIFYSNSKFGFMAADKQHMIPLNVDDTKFMEAVGVTQESLDRVKFLTDGENNYMELIRKLGLTREHCIIFAGQILFHSPNLDEFNTYRRDMNPHIGVSEYHPIFFEGIQKRDIRHRQNH